MQQIIIGFLMLAVIFLGGWLIYFYNKMTNQRIEVEERRDWLINYLQKRVELLGENQEQVISKYQIAELAEKIEVCRYLHDKAVTDYNKALAFFPGNAAKLLLGLKELSPAQNGEETPRGEELNSER